MISPEDAADILVEEAAKYLERILPKASVIIESLEREPEEVEYFDVYIALRGDEFVDDFDGNVDHFEICRQIVKSLTTEVQRRFVDLSTTEEISGVGIYEKIAIVEDPHEYENLYGSLPKDYVSYRLRFQVRFTEPPEVETRGQFISYPSELSIYASHELRQEMGIEREEWSGRFPHGGRKNLPKGRDGSDPYQSDDSDDEKPSFN